jgi:hypothetical protein
MSEARAGHVDRDDRCSPWRKLHLAVGLVGTLAFVLSGQYMHWAFDHLQGMPDGPRLFFVSSHIYLLWSSLLNLVLGCHLGHVGGRVVRKVQAAGSAALLAGPFLLGWSFFFERHGEGLARPAGRLAIFLALGGVLAHALASWFGRSKRGSVDLAGK